MHCSSSFSSQVIVSMLPMVFDFFLGKRRSRMFGSVDL